MNKYCSRCKAGNLARIVHNGSDVCKRCFENLERKDKNTKKCGKCTQELLKTEFNKDKHTFDGFNAYCKNCRKADKLKYYIKNQNKIKQIVKEWRDADPLRAKLSTKSSRYKLPKTLYQEILDKQDNRCKICKERFSNENPECADHNHNCCPARSMTCGKCFRGFLCNRCNKGLGMFRDNVKFLLASIDYLRENESTDTRADARQQCPTILDESRIGI